MFLFVPVFVLFVLVPLVCVLVIFAPVRASNLDRTVNTSRLHKLPYFSLELQLKGGWLQNLV